MYTNMLSLFPDVKFCYENKIKDKPCGYDLCFAIPKGKKFYGWFTYYLNNPVFFLVDTNKKIIHYKYTSFNPILCNTVIYGTQLYFKSNETFTIEDVLIFQSKYINLNKLKDKLQIIKYIFENLHCNQLDKKFLMFGLPYVSYDIKNLYKNKDIPYVVYSYQYRKLNVITPYLNYIVDNHLNDNYAIFKVTADDQQDMYKLYCKEGFYGYACVSSLKISKLLNNIFRNIKESNNIDLLEESDDEEEFDNINTNKYNLNKTLYMKCKFHKKFNSWEPEKIVNTKTIISKQDVKKLETI